MIEFILFLIFAVFFGLLLHGIHRKVIARIQKRPGPPIWQEILHTLKFSFKQTWIPKTASQVMYVAIVLIAIGIWTSALYVLLTGGSLLLIFAFYMLHKIMEHGTGLSSGSPYTKFGAIRSVMSAAAELPLLVTVAVVYIFTGTLSISGIAAWEWANVPLIGIALPAAISLYLIILSKAHYGPFSVIEAKELVSGYWTEHFGGWRALLNIALALKTFVLISVFIVVFLGALPWWLFLIVMVLVMISISFICATTPMLTPYNTVLIQTIWTVIVCVYGVIMWMVLSCL
ncbi:MAG: NADH-quinone oxidoreductase subunit H [Methanocorpusculum sp.]|jgi:energy-converting hydrogenase A subunit J|nr:NADH-quinone oxidoreductase subunit H [Methanocorpusculum sp.]MDD2470793.1 NADH-quinone oxidoreductase subunit H [Methanocorpusculum sp.]MDD3257733.1 NADH-quinone oxidoreductase subunit H [Methanocorpusculum sp.]